MAAGVREGSPDHAARVRCSSAAGLHLGARLPLPRYGNGSGRPLPHPRRRPAAFTVRRREQSLPERREELAVGLA